MRQQKSSPWWKKKQPTPWLGEKDLVRIKLAPSKPLSAGLTKPIAEGHRKKVYLGSAFFRQTIGGREHIVRKPVVIKTFKAPLTDEQAAAYNNLIHFLWNNRYPIPKGRIVKVSPEMSKSISGLVPAGEWVAVQQFLGRKGTTRVINRDTEVDRAIVSFRSKGRQLTGHTDVSLLFFGKKMARTDAAKLFAKLAELGVSPKFDVVAPLRKKWGARMAVPFDLDLIIEEAEEQGKNLSKPQLAMGLLRTLKALTNDGRERERLFRISFSEIKSRELRKNLVFYKKIIFSETLDEPEVIYPT